MDKIGKIRMQITYPITYFPSNWNILTVLPLFDLLHFILYCFVQAEFFHVNLCFQKEKTSRKQCVYNHGNLYLFRFTYAYVQITVHLLDFAGDKNVDFEFPDLAFLGTLFILAIKILKAKLQTFHSNVLMQEKYEKCCNWLKSRNML